MPNSLKYPILLVHGMGFRDHKILNYWGRIPKELEKMGCVIEDERDAFECFDDMIGMDEIKKRVKIIEKWDEQT